MNRQTLLNFIVIAALCLYLGFRFGQKSESAPDLHRWDSKSGDPTQTHPVTIKTLPSPEVGVQPELKNIILILGDGMGLGQIHTARVDRIGLDALWSFEKFPVFSWVMNHSADNLYTDSASSATALSTGVKTIQEFVGVDPQGEPLPHLSRVLQDHGWRVGLITDSYLWDASPSGFSAHAPNRDDHERVAESMAQSGVELLVGTQSKKAIKATPIFQEEGYEVLENWEALRNSSAPKTVGLMPRGQIADENEEPTLLPLAQWALDRLSDSEAGFFLMVESEETDSGSHKRDFLRVARGVEAVDSVASLARDFAQTRQDTLVLVMSDHETGGVTALRGTVEDPQEIFWSSKFHTITPTPLFAMGPGAEYFREVHDNTHVPRVIAGLLGLEFPDTIRGNHE